MIDRDDNPVRPAGVTAGASSRLEQRVARAAEDALAARGFVASVDVLAGFRPNSSW